MHQQADWMPAASLAAIRARAELLGQIRDFFRYQGVMEVETPVCSQAGTTDPAIASLTACYTGPLAPQGLQLYLHTSPEFPMKRLLAAGSGPIYQICKVFRDGELGRLHHPEFTLLEWYRPGFDHHDLMREVVDLVNPLLPHPGEVEKLSYAEAFQRHLCIDPYALEIQALRERAIKLEVPGAATLDLSSKDAWLDLLLTHCIEPHLGVGRMTFVYDYPASQAALARIRPGNPPVAERFELYLDGVEIANGFHELTDADEQAMRFQHENERRAAEGLPIVPADKHLLDALEQGMPDCAGVALGIDRLLMVKLGLERIGSSMAFPLDRA